MITVTRRQAFFIALAILIEHGIITPLLAAEEVSEGGWFEVDSNDEESGTYKGNAGGDTYETGRLHERYGSELNSTESNAVDPNFDHLYHDWDFDKTFDENWESGGRGSHKGSNLNDLYEGLKELNEIAGILSTVAEALSWIIEFKLESKVLGRMAMTFEVGQFGFGLAMRVYHGDGVMRSTLDQAYETYDDSLIRASLDVAGKAFDRAGEWVGEHIATPLERNIRNSMGMDQSYFPRY